MLLILPIYTCRPSVVYRGRLRTHNDMQLPARQTKVVDESQRPLKTGSPGCGSLRNDGTSSKPYCKGRDVAEDSQGGACVECCGSKRCKTCDHIFVGSTFSSNVTSKSYNVRCTGKNMSCGTKNVIYLISIYETETSF